MFLTIPTIQELQTLELSALIDMLVTETVTYSQLIERDGVSTQSIACKEVIINLQAAIEARQKLENKASGTFFNTTFKQDNT